MALDGFTIGNTSSTGAKPVTGVPVSAPVKTPGTALQGFSVGEQPAQPAIPTPAVPTPLISNIDSLVKTTKPVDTSSLFSKTLSVTRDVKAPKVSLANGGSTKAFTEPDSKDPYTDSKPVGDFIGAQDPNVRAPNIIEKTGSAIHNFLFESDPETKHTNQYVQKSIVDSHLLDIGKQLGIDKQIPVDTTKDAQTAQIKHDQAVADYVRNNWGTIKSNLEDSSALPDRPEMLGPTYSEANKMAAGYLKEKGLATLPTNMEFTTAMLLAPVAGEVGVAAGVSFGAAMGFSYIEHKILGDSIAGKIADTFGIEAKPIRNALDVIEMIAMSVALHKVYQKSPEITTKFTKNIVETYMPGQKIRFDPEKVFDILSGKNKLTTAEERIWFNKLGLTNEQMINAKNNGIPIDVAPEKVLSLIDKPYWSKIKSLFRVSTSPVEVLRAEMGSTKVGAESRPERLLGEGFKQTQEKVKVVQDEILSSVKEHGVDLTIQELQAKLGVDPTTAANLVHEAKVKDIVSNLKTRTSEVFDRIQKAKENQRSVGEDSDIPQITDTKETPVEEKPTPSKYDQIKQGLDERVRKMKNYKTYGTNKGSLMKGEGMENSAYLRQMRGEPTGIEVRNAKKYLDSAYVGKTVIVDGKEAKVISTPSYGKTKVQFIEGAVGDGAIKSVNVRDLPETNTTEEQAIEHLKGEGERKALIKIRRSNPEFKFAEEKVPDNKLTPYDTPEVIAAREARKNVDSTQNINTPEREALRKSVLDKTYGDGAKVKGKRLDIVTGGPGSRKSSMIAEPLADEHGSMIVDSDKIKPQLPEFGEKGEGAGRVHEESATINADLLKLALKNGDNVVFPTVGKTLSNLNKVIDIAKGHGYEIHLHHAELPLEKSVPSIIERWSKGHQGFVDPHYAYNEVGLKPSENYGILKNDERLKTTTKYNTDVERGQKPEVLHAGGEGRTRISDTQQGLDRQGKTKGSRDISGSDNNRASKPIEGTGETKTRGLSQGIADKAIEKKLVETMGDLPEYKTVNMKDQAQRANDLISTNYEQAKRVAMGQEIAPEGLISETVFKAVERKAILDGDVNTLMNLAIESSLTGEATAMGQRIKALDDHDPDSPVRAIKEVSKVRENLAKKRIKNIANEKKAIVDTIKKEIKKAAPKKETWNDFVSSITC